MSAPTHLRVEHLDEPFGIDTTAPRLSWRLPTSAKRQLAYRIRTGRWDTGRVESAAQVLVPYEGPTLSARERVSWQVKVWTDQGESNWSVPRAWEMGLLAPHHWIARWIEPIEPEDAGPPGERPAHVLRTTFALERRVRQARVYATAHGLYELFLNGSRIGDEELTPGFTSYPRRLHVQTFDPGERLTGGLNELRVVLSDGWFRGQVGYTREHDVYGQRLAVLAQFHVEHEDGSETVIGTGDGWQSAQGQIVAADLIAGQRVDLGIDEKDLPWKPVRVVEHDFGNLCSSPAPPVRRTGLLRPRSVRRFSAGRHVVDLGQNINGWLRLTNLGPRGTTLTVTHGESLDANEDVTIDHLAPVNWVSGEALPAGQVDVVVSSGPGSVFEPRHTTHGFQFARIEGHPGELSPDDVSGVVVHTDMRRTGWFRCSDARINQLHEAAIWSFRTNACDIPTDCPQRERAGWTGDWQIFAPTAAFLYDVAGFTTKWLRDLAVDQRSDGAVRNFAPDPAPTGADENPIKTFIEASAGWGDAAVLVPWTMWRNYGDRRLLEEQWPSMVAWVEFQANVARSARHQSRIERSETPAAHEQFLWDTGFHWGEWCEPDLEDVDHFSQNLGNDFGIIATAYFSLSARTLARVASVIDRPEEARRYDRLADAARDAWNAEYVAADGTLRSDRQADYVRALAFDLVPEALRHQTGERLVQLIRYAGTHLNTGFLATPYLLPVLADTGHRDVAFELLFQDTPPSWLTMVDRGATTIWEHWEGIDAEGVANASLNHYSKGAVVSFLHEYVGGIRPHDDGPGYRHFRIEPTPGGGITWAEAAHDSPYGRIEASWRVRNGQFMLETRVPPGTVALVRLPDGREAKVSAGAARFDCEVRSVS